MSLLPLQCNTTIQSTSIDDDEGGGLPPTEEEESTIITNHTNSNDDGVSPKELVVDSPPFYYVLQAQPFITAPVPTNQSIISFLILLQTLRTDRREGAVIVLCNSGDDDE